MNRKYNVLLIAGLLAGVFIYNSDAEDLIDITRFQRFVAIEDIVEKTPPGWFECVNYEVQSDTCEMLAKTIRTGSNLVVTSIAKLNEQPPIAVTIIDRMEIKNGLACSDGSNVKAELISSFQLDPQSRDGLIRQAESLAKMFGEVCQAYFFAESGFNVRYFSADGSEIEGLPPVRSIFLEREPDLRVGQ